MKSLERQAEVSQRTGLARSTIYKMMAEGLFPLPVRLTNNTVAWRTEEVDEWISSRPLADVKHPGRGDGQDATAGADR
jgi:prophage regulatory protein